MTNKIIILFEIITASLIILFIFYIRLFRAPNDAPFPTDTFNNANYLWIITYVFIIVVFCFIFFFSIYDLLIKKVNNNSWVNKQLFLVQQFVNNCFRSFFQFLLSLTPETFSYVFIFEKSANFFLKSVINKKYRKRLIYFFHILPRLIALFILSIDILFFDGFYYVYRFSFVLLLPVIGTFLQAAFEVFCRDNLEHFEKIFMIVDLNNHKKYTPKEYFFIWLGMIHGLKSAITKLGFEFTSAYIEKQNSLSLKTNIKWLPLETMNIHVSRYQNVLLPIKAFLEFYILEKKQLLLYFNCFTSITYMGLFGFLLYFCW